MKPISLGWCGRCLLPMAALCVGLPLARGQVQPPPRAATPPSTRLPPSDLENLIRRLEQLESANSQLRREVEQTKQLRQDYLNLERKYDDLSRRLDSGATGGRVGSPGPSPDDRLPTGGGTREEETQAIGPVRPAAGAGLGNVESSAGAPGSSSGDGRPSSGGGGREEESQPIGPDRPRRITLKSFYDYERDGFKFQSDNDEFLLRIRGETQLDARIYTQGGQNPVHSGFYLPRTRFYLEGTLTKPIEYQLSFQRGYSADLEVLNAYLNFHYDDRLRLRVGRFKTPYTYEFYKVNNWRLLTPERSLFNVNFGLNRMLGIMGWGEILEKRLEYAVGIFNGPRNSFEDYNSSKDVVAFLNYKPFEQTDGLLKNLNVGGSVDFGNQDNPLRPAVLRTSTNASTSTIGSSSGANLATVPFLAFNPNVLERGDRALWSLHLAYFWRGLTLMGAWDSGFNDYATVGNRPVHLPVGGYYAQLGYIITGESISERALVEPFRPFDLRPGQFGLGAFEPYARYSSLSVGQQVFTYGLSDPNLWSNRAELVDVGLNWYLNKFVKIYFDWEHAMFGDPVYFAPGRLQKTSDLFWFRFQVYF